MKPRTNHMKPHRLLLTSLLLTAVALSASAQGTAFCYQGRLNDNGSPANGLYDVRFMVLDAPNNGNLLAGPVTNSATGVTNGLFAVTLDFGSKVFTGPDRWLELDVRTNDNGPFTTLLPLQPLLPMPYAIMANTASNLLGTLPAAQLTGGTAPINITGSAASATTAMTAGSADSVAAANISGTILNSSLPASPNFMGTVTATFFSGNGTNLTSLNANNLASGTVPLARLPSVLTTNNSANLTIGGTNIVAPLTVLPAVPTAAIGSVGTGWAPYCVAVAGRYAYVVNYDGDTLQVIDVSTPSAPVVVGSVSTGTESGPKSVAVAGRYAYVADYGDNGHNLQIFDVSNPSVPVSVGSVAAGYAESVVVSGHYAYVTGDGNPLQIFDVSVPSAPVKVGSVSGVGGTSIVVAGRYAYVVGYPNGIKQMSIFDVSNPSAPGIVSSAGTISDPSSIAVAGRYAYVMSDSSQGVNTLQIFDVSNPSAPVSVGSAGAGNGWAFSMAVSGRYAYVANYNANTLQIFDVSNPSAPVSVGSVGAGGYPQSVVVSGRYAYVANYVGNTLQIFNLGGAYLQQLEAGAMETGTLQIRDTVIVGNNLDVLGGLTVSGSALISGGLSVNSLVGGITTNLLIGGHTFYYTNGILMNIQ